MKRIVKSGGGLDIYKTTCNFCGCVFEYSWGEVLDCCGSCVECPECGEEISTARAKPIYKKKKDE